MEHPLYLNGKSVEFDQLNKMVKMILENIRNPDFVRNPNEFQEN